MTARLIDGRAVAAEIKTTVSERAAAFSASVGRPPSLISVLVGDDPASESYAKVKGRAAKKNGIEYRIDRYPATSTTEQVVTAVAALCADPGIDAIMVEMPLPKGVDTKAVIDTIDPAKDADGITPASLGLLTAGRPGPRPATSQAVIAILEAEGIDLTGKRAIVVGRSRTVGLPAALMLIEKHATVSVAHSRTQDLPGEASRADILVAATGVPGLLGGDAIKPGATVIDVGTTWVDDEDGGRMVGDVLADEAMEVAGVLTPVRGGVGPVTTAIILRTAVDLAEAAQVSAESAI